LIKKLAFLLALAPTPLAAEDPLSAIDWLSDSVTEAPAARSEEPPAVTGGDVVPSVIEVTPIGRIDKDAVGLLPTSVTGLPQNFWGPSDVEVIGALLARQKTDTLPEILGLLYTILLAEIDPPQKTDAGSSLLLVRIDKLLEMGALDQAQALLERAGPDEAAVFRRWFDISLLTGHENHACRAMAAAPGFAPTLQARVFCLARNGDWNAAALSLATGETLGFITREDADLMTRFLDPDMFGENLEIPPPSPLTPLDFIMREAIALSRPAGPLPLAFVTVDLRDSAAWRAQLAAAERLARSNAIAPPVLFHLYTQKKPAASGGIWNRVRAIQALDIALLAGDFDAVATALPPAYAAMREVALEEPFARFYGDRLNRMDFADTPAAKVAFDVALLSPDYELTTEALSAEDDRDRFLRALAKGQPVGPTPPGAVGEAIIDAFAKPMPDGPLKALLAEGKLGEAVLRAMLLLNDEAFADPGDIQAALSAFRAVGLESEARRLAIQLLVLERRG